ncbi:MAG: polysaccharide pyruvyl transferase family protein [Egibacteraceae bacterium]
MRTLVTGWFSFERADATAGDLLAKDVVCGWLEEADHPYDVALAAPFGGGVRFETADPQRYSHVVFVCGPFFRGNLLRRFERCRLVGVNLSMVEPVEDWNPFDLLLERDSTTAGYPDVTFLSQDRPVPVVGVTLIEPADVPAHEDSYRDANAAISDLLARREAATVTIDTRLDVPNRAGLRTAAEVECLITRMDVLVTTRLHGLVLAVKNGVPAIAIDPVPGGGKLSRQAEAIGWPLVFAADVAPAELERAFDRCLGRDAAALAWRSREAAIAGLGVVRESFISAMRCDDPAGAWGDGRRQRAWVEPKATERGGPAGRLRAALRGLVGR